MSVAGDGNYLALRLVNILFVSLTPLIICLIAKRMGSPGAGVVAGAAIAVFPTQVGQDITLLSEPIYVFLHMATALLDLGLLTDGTWKTGLLAGTVNGAVALARPAALVWPLFVGIMLFVVRRWRGTLVIVVVEPPDLGCVVEVNCRILIVCRAPIAATSMQL